MCFKHNRICSQNQEGREAPSTFPVWVTAALYITFPLSQPPWDTDPVLIVYGSVEWAHVHNPLTVIHLLLSRHHSRAHRATQERTLLTSSSHTCFSSCFFSLFLDALDGILKSGRDAGWRCGRCVGGGAERWRLQDRVRSRHHNRKKDCLCQWKGERGHWGSQH